MQVTPDRVIVTSLMADRCNPKYTFTCQMLRFTCIYWLRFRETFAPETTEMALELWATMGYWANNVIFIFAGFSVGSEMFTHGPQIDSNVSKLGMSSKRRCP